MTDPADAARDSLDIHPTAPWSPTPALPEMSYAEAASRREELYANTPAAQEWRDKYFSGSVEAKAQMDQIVRALAPAPPPPSDPTSTEQLIEWVHSLVPDLSEAHIEEIKTSRPIDPVTRRRAEQWKEVHFRDPVFVQSYFDNDPEVARQVFHLNTLLSLPIRDPQT
jgi:hypothetical protein